MRRERAKILNVATENDAAWFSTGDDNGVHGGSGAREMPELACATSEALWEFLPDVAGLEQSVRRRVIVLTPGDRLGEHDGGNEGWPLAVADQCADRGNRVLASFREEADPARVQNEHFQLALGASASAVRRRAASRSARAEAALEGSPTSSMSSDR